MINRLVLSSGLGELEGNVAASEAAVDLGVGVDAVVNASALLLVEDDLEELAAVLLGADTLANNLDGVAEIGKDGVVDGGQGAGAGALLLLVVARAGSTLGAGKNAARSEDQDVAVGELLLELTGQTRGKQLEWLHRRRLSAWLKTYRCWTRWNPCREGTGTKMTTAFLPWPTSI